MNWEGKEVKPIKMVRVKTMGNIREKQNG